MDSPDETVPAQDIEPLLQRLQQPGASLTTVETAAFSSLAGDRLHTLAARWPALPDSNRVALIEQAAALAEEDALVDFVPLARQARQDPLPEVRRAVAEMLWESESPQVAQELLTLLDDNEVEVRAAAAATLLHFVVLAEEGNLRPAAGEEIIAALRERADDDAESPTVRARAIEALGPHGAAWVDDLITDAYHDEDHELRLSALRAMGNSGNEDWSEYLLDALTADDAEVRFVAAVAAGQVGLEVFTDTVAALLDDEDTEVVYVAITALGMIGGQAAVSYLKSFARRADEGLQEFLNEAIDEAQANTLDLDDEL